MKKLILLLSLIVSNSVFCNSESITINRIEHPFLDQSQLIELYDLLIYEIETYDAEAIETRNNKKAMNWVDYKNYKKPAFISSKNWHELSENFYKFARGFVNLHSKFKFNQPSNLIKQQSNIEMGYTYPEISFFINDNNRNNIKGINGELIGSVFRNYENINCPFNSTIGCLNSFVSAFRKGKINVNHEKIKVLNTKNENISVIYEELKNTSDSKTSKYLKAIDIKNYGDWNLINQGYKVAVFSKDNYALVKIKDFIYPSRSQDSFRCLKESPEKSMCSDVQIIRSSLDTINSKVETLIIDVQNNGGGNEVTPLFAELSSNEFKDLRVQYKNTPLLTNGKLRSYLFYGSEKAENWFQALPESNDVFLSIRSDFCQGGDLCQIKPIKPNSQRKFKHVYVLTNQNCVSSCDDFVWRMQEYNQAKIVGLPNAADATYSRISILFYLNKDNAIKTAYYGDGGQADYEGTEIFNITIPYSKTVDEKGQLKQGVAAELEAVFPVTKDNFNNHEKESLNQLIKLIKK